MKIEQIFFLNVTLSLRLREQIILLNVTLSFTKTDNFIKIKVLLVRTSHNISYVIFIELKIEQIFK